MKKNTLVIIGLVVLFAIVTIISWAVDSKKVKTPVNQNKTAVINAPIIDHTLIFNDYTFSPAEFAAGPGRTIKVELTNQGTVAHAFTFSKLDFNSGVIEPGKSKIVTFTTPSTIGRYEFICDQVGHKDKGMTGTMVVQ